MYQPDDNEVLDHAEKHIAAHKADLERAQSVRIKAVHLSLIERYEALRVECLQRLGSPL